jgi:ABC-type transport system involved in cytochrome bd biosynthesis fused ATPase/permease subunit
VQKLPEAPTPLSQAVAGPSLWFLLGVIPVYWIIVVFFEYKVFDVIFCMRGDRNANMEAANNRTSMFKAHQANDDEDIKEEETRVKNNNPAQMPVRVQEVTKNYGKVKAVKNLSFGLEYGECFALLGISGAGKTSVFKCLTGETYPTAGQLTINGHDVTTASGFEQARRQIGYCPQFDAIFEGLTVLEHL